jgi:excisionase family DNA binding protein
VTDAVQPQGRTVALGSLVDAITNSAVQALAVELRRQGKGGLGDVRLLRGAVREVVRRNLRSTTSLLDDRAPVEEPEPVGRAIAPPVSQAQSLPAESAQVRPIPSWSGPLVVRPRQACEMLSIGMTRLYELLHEGQLQSLRYGRSRRITTASIRDYVERHAETDPTWRSPR